MGKGFYETHPFVKDIFDQASDVLKLDVTKFCFGGPRINGNKPRIPNRWYLPLVLPVLRF
jgi:hypothetical protein